MAFFRPKSMIVTSQKLSRWRTSTSCLFSFTSPRVQYLYIAIGNTIEFKIQCILLCVCVQKRQQKHVPCSWQTHVTEVNTSINWIKMPSTQIEYSANKRMVVKLLLYGQFYDYRYLLNNIHYFSCAPVWTSSISTSLPFSFSLSSHFYPEHDPFHLIRRHFFPRWLTALRLCSTFIN